MSTLGMPGVVQSGNGGFPVAGARVTLYAPTEGAPSVIGTATTDADGRFMIFAEDGDPRALYYITAVAGGGVTLMALLGRGAADNLVINELTTVAAAYAMAQFTTGSDIRGPQAALRIALGMADNLARASSGMPSPVLQAAPNAGQTIALRTLRSLGNLLAACVRGVPNATQTLLRLATSPDGHAPSDTFQALSAIARNPGCNAGPLYEQSGLVEVFTPALEAQPDAWTLAVKVNSTGNDDHMFGGPANIAFDRNGYAWIANNVKQGEAYSGHFIVVLRPDGTPADGSDGEPKSPVFGGGLWGPGWGIDISPRTGNVWVGNYGWGKDDNPPAGSVSEFHPDGRPRSGAEGYVNGIERVQATVADAEGNIWMASYGNDSLVCYRHGDPGRALSVVSGDKPFGIAISGDGSTWVTNGAGLGWPRANPSTVCRYVISGETLVQEMEVSAGFAAKVVVVDAQKYGWVASCGDSKVYRISPDGSQITAYDGGGIDTPWGLAIDGHGDVWVANFGRLGPGEVYQTAALSVLAGDTDRNRAANIQVGTALSPPTGYTLASGGDPVLLPTGDPLYGPGADDCFTPFMRATSCQIDAAGNVWVVNNWKPDFSQDFLPREGNPGGDGIIIFVGLAKPPAAAA